MSRTLFWRSVSTSKCVSAFLFKRMTQEFLKQSLQGSETHLSRRHRLPINRKISSNATVTFSLPPPHLATPLLGDMAHVFLIRARVRLDAFDRSFSACQSTPPVRRRSGIAYINCVEAITWLNCALLKAFTLTGGVLMTLGLSGFDTQCRAQETQFVEIDNSQQSPAHYSEAQPRTELLEKLKGALEGGVFLHSDFYTDAGLKVFFSAAEITWLGNSDGFKSATLHALTSPMSAEMWRPFVSLSFTVQHPGNSKASVSIGFQGSASEITVQDIEGIFGSKPTNIVGAFDDPSFTHGHPWPVLPPSTMPMGNKVLRYDVRTFGPFDGVVSFTTDANGKLNYIGVSEREI